MKIIVILLAAAFFGILLNWLRLNQGFEDTVIIGLALVIALIVLRDDK